MNKLFYISIFVYLNYGFECNYYLSDHEESRITHLSERERKEGRYSSSLRFYPVTSCTRNHKFRLKGFLMYYILKHCLKINICFVFNTYIYYSIYIYLLNINRVQSILNQSLSTLVTKCKTFFFFFIVHIFDNFLLIC